MVKKNTPPWYGLSGGPMIVACQWNTAMERKGDEALDEGNSIIPKIKKEIHSRDGFKGKDLCF